MALIELIQVGSRRGLLRHCSTLRGHQGARNASRSWVIALDSASQCMERIALSLRSPNNSDRLALKRPQTQFADAAVTSGLVEEVNIKHHLHRLRAIVWAKSGILLTTLLNMIWLIKEFSPETNCYVRVGITAVTLPVNVLYSAALVPMYMRVMPAQRYGQFYSACFVVTSLFGVMSGVMFGAFFDVLRRCFHAPKFDKVVCHNVAQLVMLAPVPQEHHGIQFWCVCGKGMQMQTNRLSPGLSNHRPANADRGRPLISI